MTLRKVPKIVLVPKPRSRHQTALPGYSERVEKVGVRLRWREALASLPAARPNGSSRPPELENQNRVYTTILDTIGVKQAPAARSTSTLLC